MCERILNIKFENMFWSKNYNEKEIKIVDNLVKSITVERVKMYNDCFHLCQIEIHIIDNTCKILKRKTLYREKLTTISGKDLNDEIIDAVNSYICRKMRNELTRLYFNNVLNEYEELAEGRGYNVGKSK